MLDLGAMVSLKINQMMSFCTPVTRISIQGVHVESFRYLGSVISTGNSCEEDILSRICLGQTSIQQLHTCLFSRVDVSIYIKMRVYQASMRSI